MEVTLVLRPPAASKAISQRLLSGQYIAEDINPADISGDPADAKAVVDFATSHNLQVLKVDPAARSVHLAGSPADIEKAFGIPTSVNYRGPVDLPAPLNDIVIAVLGLDQGPIARHHGGG